MDTALQLAAGKLPEIAREAGRIIMAVRDNGSLGVQHKFTNDKTSPFTDADLQSNAYLIKALSALIPGAGVVSEENSEEENKRIINSQSRYWLIDPLDGTSGFISGRDGFAVNIALIDDGKPVLGAVYLPAQNLLYYTGADGKAYKQKDNEPAAVITMQRSRSGEPITIAGSYKNAEATIADMKLDKVVPTYNLVSENNAKRICMAAESANYLAIGPATSTWDTAGPDAILRAAGGVLINHESKQPMTYGKEAVVIANGKEYAFANPAYIGGQVALLQDLGIFTPFQELQHRRER